MNENVNFDLLEERLICLGLLSPEDLDFNRANSLSPRQLKRLCLRGGFWLAGNGLCICLIAVILIGRIRLNHPTTFADGVDAAILIGVILLGISAFCCFKNAEPYLKDLRDPKPIRIKGELHKHYAETPTRGGVISYWFVKIDDRVFSVSQVAHDAIIGHQTYELYYLSHTRKIVNLVRCP
jgi:hypothetical protein